MKKSADSLIAIDTQVLIYAYRSKPANAQEKKDSAWAKELLKTLREEERRICVSIITVSEFLVKIPPANHPATLNVLEQDFEIAMFNRQAAQMAATNFMHAKSRSQSDRVIMTADNKILASIAAYGCKRLIAKDTGLLKLAPIYGLKPPAPIQTQLDF